VIAWPHVLFTCSHLHLFIEEFLRIAASFRSRSTYRCTGISRIVEFFHILTLYNFKSISNEEMFPVMLINLSLFLIHFAFTYSCYVSTMLCLVYIFLIYECICRIIQTMQNSIDLRRVIILGANILIFYVSILRVLELRSGYL